VIEVLLFNLAMCPRHSLIRCVW